MHRFANYTYNYYHHNWGWHSSHHWPVWLIFIALCLAALILVFEVWMFFDCVLNKKLADTPKIWWIIGMLLLHPFVAIAYYFVVYRSNQMSAATKGKSAKR